MKKANDDIQALIESMGNISDIMAQWDEYKGILHSLKVLGEDAVEPLIEALKDPKRLIRYGAVSVLGDIKDTRAVEPLINALNKDIIQKGRLMKSFKGSSFIWGVRGIL